MSALRSDGAEFSMSITAEKHLTLAEVDLLHSARARGKNEQSLNSVSNGPKLLQLGLSIPAFYD